MLRLWGEAERHQVAALLLAGKSAAAIAREFGVTKNAALGRIVRDDALHHLIAKPVLSRKTKLASLRLKWGWHQPKPFVYEGRKFKPPPVRAAPRMRLFSLTDLAVRGECRWPVEESAATVGGFLFCAAPCGLEESYCLYHKRLAYRLAGS
jgi:hypothetical protein